MYKYILFILLIINSLIIQTSFASGNEKNLLKNESPEEDNADIIDLLDSMVMEHFCLYNTFIYLPQEDSLFLEKNTISVFPDSVLAAKLQSLNSPVSLELNEHVKNFIKLYAFKRREQVSRMLGLTHLYYPMIEKYLDQNDIPLELKHLAVIESALNPNAVSKAGATGMWQLMYNTGKIYGIEITSYIDERRDPEKSTIAAIGFLKDLYRIYNDWLLVIAAYNCGPGNVNKAIRRSGGKTTFWEIERYLPRETRGYVPAFIAANYIMNYYKDFKIYPIEPPAFCFQLDTLQIRNSISFEAMEKYLPLSKEVLEYLNPSVKKGLIPRMEKPFILNIPRNQISFYEKDKEKIFAEMNLDNSNNSNAVNDNDEQPLKFQLPESQHTTFTYTIKSGDNLSYIAAWYNCNVKDICNWNNLGHNNIKVGQKLKIFVLTENAGKYSEMNNLSFEEKQNKAGISQTVNVKNIDGNYVYYKVRTGDTLWDIAKKYDGIGVDDLIKLNNINNSKTIKPGMMLKIHKS